MSIIIPNLDNLSQAVPEIWIILIRNYFLVRDRKTDRRRCIRFKSDATMPFLGKGHRKSYIYWKSSTILFSAIAPIRHWLVFQSEANVSYYLGTCLINWYCRASSCCSFPCILFCKLFCSWSVLFGGWVVLATVCLFCWVDVDAGWTPVRIHVFYW